MKLMELTGIDLRFGSKDFMAERFLYASESGSSFEGLETIITRVGQMSQGNWETIYSETFLESFLASQDALEVMYVSQSVHFLYISKPYWPP